MNIKNKTKLSFNSKTSYATHTGGIDGRHNYTIMKSGGPLEGICSFILKFFFSCKVYLAFGLDLVPILFRPSLLDLDLGKVSPRFKMCFVFAEFVAVSDL